ncbi:MAG: hypothetical protein ACI9KE_002414 [Polyangiales bacterium]
MPTRDSEDARAVADVDSGGSTENRSENVFPIIEDGDPYVDSDTDGMEDSWEMAEFGELGRDGTADEDGDGFTDLEGFWNQVGE